jgi:hypothetical protein
MSTLKFVPGGPYTSDMIYSIALFYILIFSTYVFTLLTFNQQRYITEHNWVKFLIGFFCFYFIVTLLSDFGLDEYQPPIQKFLKTIIYFFIFMLSVRLDNRIMILVLSLIFLSYFIEKNKEYYTELFKNNQIHVLNENKNPYYDYEYWITMDYPIKIRLFKVDKSQLDSLTSINELLYYVIIISIIFGFICYAGELKKLLKNPNVTWEHILLNDIKCGYRNPNKSLFYYFKNGLNVLY